MQNLKLKSKIINIKVLFKIILLLNKYIDPHEIIVQLWIVSSQLFENNYKTNNSKLRENVF